MKRFARRSGIDSNHVQVVNWFLDLLCSVADLSGVGWGVSDLLVGCAGVNVLVEVKDDDGKLRPSQKLFGETWRGAKPIVVRSHQDVIDLVQRIRQGVRA